EGDHSKIMRNVSDATQIIELLKYIQRLHIELSRTIIVPLVPGHRTQRMDSTGQICFLSQPLIDSLCPLDVHSCVVIVPLRCCKNPFGVDSPDGHVIWNKRNPLECSRQPLATFSEVAPGVPELPQRSTH